MSHPFLLYLSKPHEPTLDTCNIGPIVLLVWNEHVVRYKICGVQCFLPPLRTILYFSMSFSLFLIFFTSFFPFRLLLSFPFCVTDFCGFQKFSFRSLLIFFTRVYRVLRYGQHPVLSHHDIF